MDFRVLKDRLIQRLDEGDRGDRGWFIITRVHVATHWVKGIIDFLYTKGGSQQSKLSGLDYRRIGAICGIASSDPGRELRRHHLLVLEKPLQLIQRENPRSWQQGIALTDLGIMLAETGDPSNVLESCLDRIRFATEPWSPPDRVDQYSDFDVAVYRITKRAMARCNGYITRDEFDLFLSRIRMDSEFDITMRRIQAFREITDEQKQELINLVRSRIPTSKTYSNWRDVALHTFSLFSLGTSIQRDGTRIVSVRNWFSERTRSRPQTRPGRRVPRRQAMLRIPEPNAGGLESPPATPTTNDGTDGESFVAKVFRNQGWSVSFYTNKRGYGFDLWAHKDDSALVIEVKSSIGRMGSVTLTETEYKAANEYGDNFILAIVENLDSDNPTLNLVQNPTSCLPFRQSRTTAYVASRSQWEALI